LFEAERARRESEQRYEVTLRSIGDAVIATEGQGRVEMLNPVAESLTGWKESEARGKPLSEVFRIINEESRQPVEDPVTRVLREGIVVGLANHTLLIARDGREIPIADAGAPIRDEGGRISGVVLVFRDQTAERRAERAVAEARDFAESIIATVREPLLVLDAGLRVVSANRSFYRVFEVKPEETVGRLVYELGNRQWDIPALRRLLEQVLPQNTQFNDYEVTHEFERIGRRTMLLNARRLYREANKTQMILLAIEDITERKRAEMALRESEERYRTILEQASDAIFMHDESGRIVEVNRKACESLGYSREELLTKVIGDIDPKAIQTGKHKLWKRVLAGEQFTFESEHVRKDGGVIPVEVTLGAVRFATGTRIVGFVRDISERRMAEGDRARLAAAIEQAAEAVIITDADAKIQYVNPIFEKMTGYSRQEAVGQNPRILKSGKHDAEFYRRMWAVLTRGEVWSGRLTNRRKDGTLYEEEKTISPVRDAAGRIVNYVAVARDVTRESQLEAQLRQAQKMESIGRLAGGVAHDFNNILMAIIGYSDMAIKRFAPDDVRRGYVEEVRRAGDRAAALTRQLLAFSRQQILQPRVLDLNELVQNLTKMLRRLIGEDIELTLSLDPTLGCVKADPGQIEQVIMNLAVNARDAMPGGGQLVIQTANAELDEAYAQSHAEARPGRYVLLAVGDTGCGMTEEVQQHLFEPFFTTKELGKGTGLGLATVYGIVKQSEGFINVYSEVGRGTTLKIYLPRMDAPAEKAASTETRPTLMTGTETLLLVEDEAPVRKLAATVLRECGYTVLEAANGDEAADSARRHSGPIHLLMTDMVMPGLNGRELAQQLRAARPGLRVVYMSGYTDTTILHRGALEEGMFFLQKPFTAEVLARTVREALDRPPVKPS
ncbi:MAG: PAS domain S-box protein, partial [Verrucomicrobiae bacterium]|nr:PAS domain S-box protein [Verrucomicrobiae bacterium]